jgi:hypothetical protein
MRGRAILKNKSKRPQILKDSARFLRLNFLCNTCNKCEGGGRICQSIGMKVFGYGDYCDFFSHCPSVVQTILRPDESHVC